MRLISYIYPSRWVVVAGAWRATVLRPATAPGVAGSTTRNSRHSSLLQLCAWGAPAALTAAVLVTRDVDADELSGETEIPRRLRENADNFEQCYVSYRQCSLSVANYLLYAIYKHVKWCFKHLKLLIHL